MIHAIVRAFERKFRFSLLLGALLKNAIGYLRSPRTMRGPCVPMVFALLLCFMPGGIAGQSARSLDAGRLKSIRDNLTYFHDLKPDRRLDAVKRIDGAPQRYLMRIARNGSLRMHVRIRALVLLGFFADDATGAFLERAVLERDLFRPLRGWAVRSYARAFLRKNPVRARRFLERVAKSRDGSVSECARKALRRKSR